MSSVVTEEHVQYCFNVLIAHLKKERFPNPTFPNDEYFAPLHLHEGLRKYALISALKDHRFAPIQLKEIVSLTCGVSLLTNFEEADDYLDWEVGKHGIWIEFKQLNGQTETATYLPEVMKEQQWTKEEAIESLLLKGDFKGKITNEYCLNSIVLTRYQSQKLEMPYKGII
ncbi:hypothetical protein INT48_001672 [Thamnidium elegans]|uniref:AMMECR1 domain-containing protein n=1 Tax=Thamnidium elegans TaxID=101142 RepID=A0A8H7SJ65_9FUNG|nr:hypothetical protein INT48_001672 [Thamnidium elegans]